MSASGLLAIDVGTSRVKLGWFPDAAPCDSEKPSQLRITAPRLPEPAEVFSFHHRVDDLEFAATLGGWLTRFDTKPSVAIASVHPSTAYSVQQVLREKEFLSPKILATDNLFIKLNVNEPNWLGIDRALSAMAVNRIRTTNTPAIVVSLGTACTVNFISADGVFEGGAILPGFAMALQALHQGTAMLPLVSHESLSLPRNAVGKNTAEAIAAGVFWGMVGSIEKLITEQSRSSDKTPQLFLTGGDAPLVVDALEAAGHQVRVMPHLVLSGIAIACEAQP
jgi:type III pantothenate kinase